MAKPNPNLPAPVMRLRSPTLQYLVDEAATEPGLLLACTIDVTTPAGRAAIIDLAGPADHDSQWLEDHPGTPIVGYCLGMAQLTSEAGEIVIEPALKLMTESGETVGFVSRGAVKSLDLIIALFGDGPWNPPLPFRVRRKTLKGGRQYLTLGVMPV